MRYERWAARRTQFEAYRRSLALDPVLGEAYLGLANLKVAAFSDDEVAAMRDRRCAARACLGGPPATRLRPRQGARGPPRLCRLLRQLCLRRGLAPRSDALRRGRLHRPDAALDRTVHRRVLRSSRVIRRAMRRTRSSSSACRARARRWSSRSWPATRRWRARMELPDIGLIADDVSRAERRPATPTRSPHGAGELRARAKTTSRRPGCIASSAGRSSSTRCRTTSSTSA